MKKQKNEGLYVPPEGEENLYHVQVTTLNGVTEIRKYSREDWKTTMEQDLRAVAQIKEAAVIWTPKNDEE